jgi:hypothetical protein
MKTLTLTIAAVVAMSAGAAAARPWQSINERQARLDHRIDRGVRNGQLTRPEARRLHRDFRQIARLEYRYRRHGLSAWERRDLDRRFDMLSARIRDQRHDYQARY